MTDREEQYKQLVRQLLALLEGEHAYMSVLANTAAALRDTFGERFFWVGFYMVIFYFYKNLWGKAYPFIFVKYLVLSFGFLVYLF